MLEVRIYAQSIAIARSEGAGPWEHVQEIEVLSFAPEGDFFSIESDQTVPGVWWKVTGRYGGEPTLAATITGADWVDAPGGRRIHLTEPSGNRPRSRLLDAAGAAWWIRHDKPGVRRVDRSVPREPDPETEAYPMVPASRATPRQGRLAAHW